MSAGPGIAAVALVVACAAESEAPPRAPAAPTFVAKLQAAEERMHARFGAARRLEQAIALGDLVRAREEARAISHLDEPDVLPTWQPHFAGVADTARAIATAPDIVSAAKHTGMLGQRCARCHEAARARIVFADEPRPPEDPLRGPTMAAHQWAAALMWLGLIGPSDERWRRGAEALTSVPLTLVAQAPSASSDVDPDDVAKVRLQARRALAAAPDDRAAIFGAMLATCAHCHATLRDR